MSSVQGEPMAGTSYFRSGPNVSVHGRPSKYTLLSMLNFNQKGLTSVMQMHVQIQGTQLPH